MNGKETIQIARIDERCIAMHEDLKDMKKIMKEKSGCLIANEMAITKLDTAFVEHIKTHRRDLALVTIFIAVIAIVLQFIPLGG